MKPALLLLHGALGAHSDFDAIAELLSGQYTVYRFNFHGHGGSPLPVMPLSINMFAEQLLEYIHEQKLAPVAVFGYSMGGYVALHAALQSPASFSRILTLATKFDWSPESAAKEVRQLNAAVLLEKAPAFAARQQQLHGEQEWEQLLTATAVMMENLGGEPLLTADALSQITVPVRVMVGDRDAMVSIEETVQAYRHMPQASLTVLPDTRHPLDRVNTAVLIWEIRSFMTV
ncbi:alpha/beta fold hydrolase [Chitinophaga lutea]|uniref:Alpha/beta fold hydrolase n=1 Tax=Chitinophaga lutea TaxID=2488634 RepID=A0A3N4Q7U8_9BACT|nr:alpha/beta fold hydrolase [Chitinophaga lutea]RPE12147.1 alpha/beta fold hydrolase [Chitinophaga lutea]